MFKKVAVALATLGIGLGGLATIAAPSQAAPATPVVAVAAKPSPKPTTHQVEIFRSVDGKLSRKVDNGPLMKASAVADYRFTGTRFADKWICQLDGTGPNTPVATTGDAFESGTNPVGTVVLSYRPIGQGCPGYATSQELVFREYSAADGFCSKILGPTTTPTAKQNPYYDYIWNGSVVISINTYYSNCRDTAQRRANATSRITGDSLGLAEFTNTTTDAIMNTHWWRTYSLAGPFDRNNLALLY